VEDAPVARELLVGVLRAFGHTVVEAGDGREGLRLALEKPPDLVLTDVEMPYMDGLEMLRRFKDDQRLARVPAMVLTTRTDPQVRSHADALGVRGFLSKQKYVESELADAVRKCLGQ